MNTSLKIISKIIDVLGNFCSLLMLLMIANVFYDVIMRYFFNDVSIGMQELEWHLFAAMFMFGIAYTLKEDAHVRVDIFYDVMSAKKKALVNIFGSVVFALPITLLILYYGYDYAFEAYSMGEGSGDPGGLPHRWIVRSVIPISSCFLVLSIVYVLLTNIQVLRAVQIVDNASGDDSSRNTGTNTGTNTGINTGGHSGSDDSANKKHKGEL